MKIKNREIAELLGAFTSRKEWKVEEYLRKNRKDESKDVSVYDLICISDDVEEMEDEEEDE